MYIFLISNYVRISKYVIIGIKYCAYIWMRNQWCLNNWKGCKNNTKRKKKQKQKKKNEKTKQPPPPKLTNCIIIATLLSYFTNYVKNISAVIIMPSSRTRYHHTVFSSIIVWLICIPVCKDHFTAGIIPHPVTSVFILYASGPPSVSRHWNIQVYYS